MKWSDEDKKKKSDTIKNNEELMDQLRTQSSANAKKMWADPAHREKSKKTWSDKYDSLPWESLEWTAKRKRVIRSQSGKCRKCGRSEWMGEPLPLEVDHIDGNHKNNARENLDGLCPNCHSITPTWRGRNKTNPGFSDEDYWKAFQTSNNIRQALLKMGLAAKGGNYQKMKDVIEKFKNLESGG